MSAGQTHLCSPEPPGAEIEEEHGQTQACCHQTQSSHQLHVRQGQAVRTEEILKQFFWNKNDKIFWCIYLWFWFVWRNQPGTTVRRGVRTRYPWFRSIKTDFKAHHNTIILSCDESKSIFWRRLEAVFPVFKDGCVLGNFRLPLIWSRHQQLSVLPSLPGCCFDLFTSQSRSAVLHTTDMPLPSTQLETSHSTFGME